ncbi:MAG TPA: hypothetical protein VGM32_07540 [Rhodopila sp.]|jgi:hypothetical protein
MTRISSLLVASTLAILPLSAFAQPTAARGKPAEPAGITTAAPNTPVSGKTASTATAKPDAKTEVPKSEVHGMNTATSPHHAKTGFPAKTAEPTKS